MHQAATIGNIFRYIHIHIHIYIHVYIYTCVYVYVFVYVCVYIYINQAWELPKLPGEYTGLKKADVQGPQK